MNKSWVIEKLQEQTLRSKEECQIISAILESHFLFKKENEIKIMNDIKEELHIDEKESQEITTIALNIIKTGIKEKIKHPFRSQIK